MQDGKLRKNHCLPESCPCTCRLLGMRLVLWPQYVRPHRHTDHDGFSLPPFSHHLPAQYLVLRFQRRAVLVFPTSAPIWCLSPIPLSPIDYAWTSRKNQRSGLPWTAVAARIAFVLHPLLRGHNPHRVMQWTGSPFALPLYFTEVPPMSFGAGGQLWGVPKGDGESLEVPGRR